MVQAALRAPNNYKYEILTHLTVAYHYGPGTYIHNTADRDIRTTGYNRIANDFITLVRDNCNRHRDMGFYDKEYSMMRNGFAANFENFSIKRLQRIFVS